MSTCSLGNFAHEQAGSWGRTPCNSDYPSTAGRTNRCSVRVHRMGPPKRTAVYRELMGKSSHYRPGSSGRPYSNVRFKYGTAPTWFVDRLRKRRRIILTTTSKKRVIGRRLRTSFEFSECNLLRFQSTYLRNLSFTSSQAGADSRWLERPNRSSTNFKPAN
jgi:hypothetical protein